MLIENSVSDFLKFLQHIYHVLILLVVFIIKKHFHMCLKYDTMLLNDLSMVDMSSTK